MGPEAEGDDSDTYEALFRREGPVLWRTIYAYSGGRRAVADDAVAEAFARALEHRNSIRDPLRWLYRVAFRVARGDLEERTSPGMADGPAGEPAEDIWDVVQALRKLSPSQRAAVFLHYHADQPVREVARLMETSVAAVKVHLFRGRRRLRSLLGGEEVSDA